MRSFSVKGKERPAISVGSSEHFALPSLHPGLREVNVYLGWFSNARAIQAVSSLNAGLLRVPGLKSGLDRLIERFVPTSTGGPDEAARKATGSQIAAIAYGAGDQELARVEVAGVNGYTFTGNVLAWGATSALEQGMEASGALGPATAFGLDRLVAGCAEAGIARVP